MRIKPLLLSLPLGSILAGGIPAIAQDAGMAASTQPPVAQVTPLTIRQVYDKVEAAGFTDIMEIERDSDVFEVKAIDPHGKKAKLKVDLVTGEILKSESKAKKEKKEKKEDASAKKDEEKQVKDDKQGVVSKAGAEGDKANEGDEGDQADKTDAAAPTDQQVKGESQPSSADAPKTKADSAP
jgi:hypothetical protein